MLQSEMQLNMLQLLEIQASRFACEANSSWRDVGSQYVYIQGLAVQEERWAVVWVRQSFGVSPLRPEFETTPVCVGFVVHKGTAKGFCSELMYHRRYIINN